MTLIDNSAPFIEAAEQFIVTINETSILIMNITDPGDTFNVTIEGNLPAEYTFENTGSMYMLSIMIKSVIEDLTITVMAKDSMGAVSAIQPQVKFKYIYEYIIFYLSGTYLWMSKWWKLYS